MAFTVSTFKSSMAAQSGGARPALYQIDIDGGVGITAASFTGSENILCKAASIPPANIAPLAVNYAGRAYKWNGFRTYDNWTVTVINDESFSIRNKMMNWMRKLGGRLEGTRSSVFGEQIQGTGFKDGSAKVTQLSTAGTPMQTYKFDYLWPTEIAGIPVDWSSDAIQEYTITFAYDYWTHGSVSTTTGVVPPPAS
jgi:hypothetical protein